MLVDIRSYLDTHLVVGDGAMGTYLYQLGIPVGFSLEELNISRPDVIEQVHREYLLAGAQIIETNTYAANRQRLARYGLENQVRKINQAAVLCGRSAIQAVQRDLLSGADQDFLKERPAFLFGAVGGINRGKAGELSEAELEEIYLEQMEALLETEIEGLILETFIELAELQLALRVARRLDRNIPLVAQLSIKESGRTEEGVPLKEALISLQEGGADVVGLNCYSGPHTMIRLLEQGSLPPTLPLSVYPNAGLPEYQEGQLRYTSTPEYFGQSALRFRDLGVRLFGGCCGTTPKHIAAVAEALADLEPRSISSEPLELLNESISVIDKEERDTVLDQQGQEVVGWRHRELTGETIPDLVRNRHTVVVELDPPKDLDIEPFLQGATMLQEAGMDALTMADNSLAMTRMSNMALGAIIKEKLGIRPLVHITCRDRNLIGQQSHLMGLDALGIDHLLAITGDPTRHGDLPGASSVYDVNTFELIQMIKQLNRGLSFCGKGLEQKARFTVAAALNPNAVNLEKAIERMERKIASGADFIMTQPVYKPALMIELYERTKHLKIPVFIGIMPLVSSRNAMFLHHEVPGITLPNSALKRMARFEGKAAEQQGLEIAMELLEVGVKYFKGIYLITPFLRYEMTLQLLQEVWHLTGTKPSYQVKRRLH